MSGASGLRPAKPWGWVIRVVQTFLRFDLSWGNRVRIGPTDLAVLGELPEVQQIDADSWISLKVRGKGFGYLWEKTETVGLKATVEYFRQLLD